MQIIARRAKETAKPERKPSLDGDVLPFFTSRLINTKVNVVITSMKKQLNCDTLGSFGNNIKISVTGTPPLDLVTPT